MFEPQTSSLLPHNMLLPEVVDDEVATNCEDPHTAAFDQVEDVLQTELELSTTYTRPEFGSYEAVGDRAFLLAKSVLLKAASTSTYPAPMVKTSY